MEHLGHEVPEDEAMAPAALGYVLAEKAKQANGNAGSRSGMDSAPTGTDVVSRYLRGE